MKRTNLSVALWALVDLWKKKQRKDLPVSLAQDDVTQVFTHQCPSM